jgi:hypothetical protein
VILADITARLTPFDAARFIDAARGVCAVRVGGWSPKDLHDNRDVEIRREQKEGERIAYVAATRARDLLVVPAVGDGPYTEGWIAPLSEAIYPVESMRRQSAPAAGCPTFRSRDSVLNRPDGDPAMPRTVSPGEHRLGEAGDAHTVVWWSPEPGVLNLDAPPTIGLRRDDLIVRDVAPSVLRRYLDAYTLWRNGRDAAGDAASRPSLVVRTAIEASVTADMRPGEPVDVRVVSLQTGDDRPRGARFGALVHALLAEAPLGEAPLEAIAAAYGRVFGATGDEIEAAQQVARQVSAHPLVAAAGRAATEGRCYRETPVTYTCDDGSIVEGTVDLAYEAGETFVVIDFKTDRPEPALLERYRRQVAWYAAAIGRATGRPVDGVLMTI